MDLMAAIGLLSSIVTLEEAGRSWVLIVKDKLKRKEIDINNLSHLLLFLIPYTQLSILLKKAPNDFLYFFL